MIMKIQRMKMQKGQKHTAILPPFVFSVSKWSVQQYPFSSAYFVFNCDTPQRDYLCTAQKQHCQQAAEYENYPWWQNYFFFYPSLKPQSFVPIVNHIIFYLCLYFTHNRRFVNSFFPLSRFLLYSFCGVHTQHDSRKTEQYAAYGICRAQEILLFMEQLIRFQRKGGKCCKPTTHPGFQK